MFFLPMFPIYFAEPAIPSDTDWLALNKETRGITTTTATPCPIPLTNPTIPPLVAPFTGK